MNVNNNNTANTVNTSLYSDTLLYFDNSYVPTTDQNSNYSSRNVSIDTQTYKSRILETASRIETIPRFQSEAPIKEEESKFRKFCQLADQQLTAEHLDKFLEAKVTCVIKQWLITSAQNPNYYIVPNKTPLEIAADCGNQPICEVIIKYLKNVNYINKNTDLNYNNLDKNYKSVSAFIACSNIQAIINSCKANNYGLSKYLYSELLPTLKQYCISSLYPNCSICYTLYSRILESISNVDFFDIVYKDFINLSDKECETFYVKYYLNILFEKIFSCYPYNKEVITYILNNTTFFSNDCEARVKKQFLYKILEKKQFDIASKALAQVNKKVLNDNLHEVYVSDINKYPCETLFTLVACYLDIKTLLFFLTNIDFLAKDITNCHLTSAIVQALLSDNYIAACLLKLFGFKAIFNTSFIKDKQINEIYNFIENPLSLSRHASVVFGLKCFNEQLTIEQIQEIIAQKYPVESKKIQSLTDVFSLNRTDN